MPESPHANSETVCFISMQQLPAFSKMPRVLKLPCCILVSVLLWAAWPEGCMEPGQDAQLVSWKPVPLQAADPAAAVSFQLRKPHPHQWLREGLLSPWALSRFLISFLIWNQKKMLGAYIKTTQHLDIFFCQLQDNHFFTRKELMSESLAFRNSQTDFFQNFINNLYQLIQVFKLIPSSKLF